MRVVDLKRGERSVTGGRWARCERLIWPLRLTQCWCTPRRGSWALAIAGGEEERQENRSRDWQCARAVMSKATRRARLLRRLWPSASDERNTVLLFAAGQRRQGADANLRVVSRRSPSLGVAGEDCSLEHYLSCAFPMALQLLSTRSPANSSSHTRSWTSARHCLLRLEASARRLAGGFKSACPSNVDHDEAETPFPDFCAGKSRCSD